MAGIKVVSSLVKAVSGRSVPLPPKQVDRFYLSPEHRAWRERVIARAGRRCEAIDDGIRCSKAEPKHRMFADHIDERRDGGAWLAPANGKCLCGKHHSLKTAQARAKRAAG